MGTHPIFESDFDCLTEMARCLQVLFVFINFLVFVLGAALTALSIWLLVDPDSLFELVNSISTDTGNDIPEVFDDIINAVSAALYLSLATGIFLFLMGFLGCCGAAKKNKCMLNIFSGVKILFNAVDGKDWKTLKVIFQILVVLITMKSQHAQPNLPIKQGVSRKFKKEQLLLEE